MTARTIGGETRTAFALHDRLGHDGTGGVAGAKKQNVGVRHESSLGSQCGYAMASLLRAAGRATAGFRGCDLRLDRIDLYAGGGCVNVVL
jgi:hypothetical protein